MTDDERQLAYENIALLKKIFGGGAENVGCSEGATRMILTPEQACKEILEMLHKSVENIPEERRDEVLEKVVNAFSGQMFQGPAEKPEAEAEAKFQAAHDRAEKQLANNRRIFYDR